MTRWLHVYFVSAQLIVVVLSNFPCFISNHYYLLTDGEPKQQFIINFKGVCDRDEQGPD